MKQFGIVTLLSLSFGFALVAFGVMVKADTQKQIPPITDPYVQSATLDNRYVSEIYMDSISQVITYRESDLQTNTVTLERSATNPEILSYTLNKALMQQNEAKVNVASDPENGMPFANWVTNQVAAMQSCDADMTADQVNSFSGRTDNGKDVVIKRIEQCTALANKNGAKVIQRVYDMALANGWLTEQ